MEEKNKKIESFSAKNGNKLTYILLVEDLSVTAKYRAFVGASVSYEPAVARIKGYEVNWSDRNKINSFDDAISLANKRNKSHEDAIEISYPWQRVINIRNISYKRSDLK